MSDAAWKKFERRVAKAFGGKRRGAYTGSNGGGKTDVIVDGWAIECKLLSRPGYQSLLDAALQAERNAETGEDIPVAVVKRKGDLDVNALVVMRFKTFQDWFLEGDTNGRETIQTYE